MSNTDEWEQKFEAIVRLYREAHDKVEATPPDVLSAAVRARQAIEHIAIYLHTREIGAPGRNEMLDAMLKRVDAKLMFPRMVGPNFGTVQIHANAIIHAGSTTTDPDPSLLKPCLGALEIVVDWFFREYLKRPSPTRDREGPARRDPVTSSVPPDATPLNSTMATMFNPGTKFGTGIGEFIPVWRGTAVPSTLRFEAEGDPTNQKAFKIEDAAKNYSVGREGAPNDFTFPKTWSSISRQQATVSTVEGDVLLSNSSDKPNVFVRGELVPPKGSRALRHGDSLQLGRCLGTFSDGRYYASAPASAIDPRTGLLSRLGLIAEISGALAARSQRVLFVVRCPEASLDAARDPELIAAKVAAAIHRHDPSVPVARIEMDVAALLPAASAAAAFAAIAERAAGGRCATGYLTLVGTADQALPRLEASLGALNRVAIAGHNQSGPDDLSRYALTPTSIDRFVERTRPLFELGGGVILFAIDDVERLQTLAPQAVPVLELELIELLGSRMGPRDLVTIAAPGAVLFGTPGDVERFAHELGVIWHGRGPVTANSLEIDRSLSTHLLAESDLNDLEERASALASGGNALGASGFPAPIALAARAVDEARDPLQRARALVTAADVAWRFTAFVLMACSRGLAAGNTSADPQAWPPPWRGLASDAAAKLTSQAPRIQELATAVNGEAVQEANQIIASATQLLATSPNEVARAIPRMEKAVRELFAGLAPLRGWTLVGIESSEVIDPDGVTQRIEYVDYTGANVRGSHQRVTVVGFRALGRFAYLVRWNEGLAIALEPFVRRIRSERTGDHDVYVAVSQITQPGPQRYRSISGTDETELAVTARQLGL